MIVSKKTGVKGKQTSISRTMFAGLLASSVIIVRHSTPSAHSRFTVLAVNMPHVSTRDLIEVYHRCDDFSVS